MRVARHAILPAAIRSRPGILTLPVTPTRWYQAYNGTFSDSGLTTPVSSDGSVVGGWVDRAGGKTLTQGTGGSKPLLKTNRWYGKPVVQFDGATHFMSADVLAGTSFTIAIAVQFNSIAGLQYLIHNGSTTTGWEILTNSGAFAAQYTGVSAMNDAKTPGAGVKAIIILRGDATDKATLRVNGVDRAITNFGAAMTTPSGSFFLGCYADAASFFASVDVLELIIWNSRLTDTQTDQVHDYLNAVSRASSYPRIDMPGTPTRWYQAESGTYSDTACTTQVSGNGVAVGGWKDRMGNSNFVQATGAAQPTIQQNSWNGASCLRFDGVDDTMAAAVMATDEYTIAMACDFNGSGLQYFWHNGNGSSGVELLSNSGTLAAQHTGIGAMNDASTPTTKAIIVLRRSASAGASLWVNGVERTITGPTTGITTPSGAFNLAAYTGPLYYCQMDLYEFVAWSSRLSDDQLQQAFRSMNQRAGAY